MKRPYILKPPDYRKAISAEVDFYIQFNSMIPEVEARIIRMLHRFLEYHDLTYFKDPIYNIVKELISNAIKANLKRLYFKINNMDIEKKEDYRDGMEKFKEDIYQTDSEKYIALLAKYNLVVRAAFKATDDTLYINVINNMPVLDMELQKINSRIKKAYSYADITEAFDEVLDDSEGAGLGLIMAMMIFKNTGLRADAFKIYRRDNLTIASIAIPQTLTVIKSKIQVAEEILSEIEDIPAFPENIIEIQRLCSDPEVPMKKIAMSISRDPGLTTAILKLANSAGYITINKVDSIVDAAKIIGVKGINMLLMATGVHRIIDARYKKFEQIWQESYKRAFYAQRIASQLQLTKVGDFVYLAALLADIGYIIFLSLKPKLINRLQEMSGYKGPGGSMLLEEISLGLSHSTLGAMICKKWKFNNNLVKTIEFHHRPHIAPKKLKQLIYIVYLADCFIAVEQKKSRFEILDEDVLEFFQLNEKELFETTARVLKESYKTIGK